MQLQAKRGKEGKKKSRASPGAARVGRTTFTLASSCERHCYAPPVDNPHTQAAGPPGGTWALRVFSNPKQPVSH